jgi:hypothetical protein
MGTVDYAYKSYAKPGAVTHTTTWEAEIRRTVVQGQNGQKVHKTPFQ